jgi:heterodisulfide reductase subunit B/heterodisulfide reductase subunit C
MSVFWGCTIPARFPFIEKATRIVLADCGAQIVDVAGYTCCPEGTLVKAMDEQAYLVTAARNLALAEESEVPLMTPCNGCYSTFRSAQAQLRSDWRRREQVNSLLQVAGHSLQDGPVVKHFAEWLYDEVGPAGVSKRVTRPLAGMRLAVHYGCHLLRPSPAVRWDSSTNPGKLEELVTALGATVVDYETKMDCCGGALDRVGERDGALEFCRRKLGDLESNGVDGLVVVCPSCFQQFDLNQAALLKKKEAEGSAIPVFYYAELLALATGHAPEEMGLDLHRVATEPFLETWAGRTARRQEVARHFSLAELQKCDSCKACEEDCPVAKVQPSFSPTSIIGEILSGNLEGVIEEAELWKCLECYTCYERCHSRLGMAEVFRKLKELALGEERVPAAVTSAYDMFVQTGSLGEPRESVRAKLGLDPLPERGGEELRRVLASRKPEGGAS